MLFGSKYAPEIKGKLQYHYKIKSKLGRGTYSIVRYAIKKSNQLPVAIKIMDKHKLNEQQIHLIKREVTIMETLDHPNIVKLLDVFETVNHLYLVMEYINGGELFDELINMTPNGYFNENDASNIIKQIASGMKYIKSKNVLHRDLKLENILIAYTKPKSGLKKLNIFSKQNSSDNNMDSKDNNETDKSKRNSITKGNSYVIKITDFGMAKTYVKMSNKGKQKRNNDNSSMNTFCGTLFYVAPEILLGKPYDFKCDMWSFGVIIYVLLIGNLPFYSDNDDEIPSLVLKGDYNCDEQKNEQWGKLSENAKDLIKHLLILDKNKRYSIDDVLSHDFIKQQNLFKSVLNSKWNPGSLLKSLNNVLSQSKHVSTSNKHDTSSCDVSEGIIIDDNTIESISSKRQSLNQLKQ